MEEAQFWIDKLVENIQYQLRHENYLRTVELREFSHSMSTGIGQEKEVTRYRRWEQDDLKAQRNRLFNTLTKYALARPRKYFKKVARVEGIRMQLDANDETKLADLKEFYQSFLSGQTLDQWVWAELDTKQATDPNAWIVCERQNIVGASGQTETVRPYAFVFQAVDCLNFEYDNAGAVSWFLGRTSTIEHIVFNGVRREKVLENYYLYAPGFAARARERGEKTQMEDGEFLQLIDVFPSMSGLPTQREFYLKIVENATTETPAICAGCYFDEAVSGRNTFVPWFYPAEHLLKDLIKYKSTEDVVMTVHAYPKRWEFEKECGFESDEGNCERGYLNGDKGRSCPHCKGTGFHSNFSTEQASVKLLLPGDAESQDRLLDLSKLSFVEQVQIDLLTHIGQKVEETEKKIFAAIFDTGLYQKPTTTETRTATEVRSEMDGVSDVLRPYADHCSRVIEFFYRIGAQYNEFELKVDHSFPEDFNITTLSDEVSILTEMNDSGVGFEAISNQKGRVLEKVFEGQPMERDKAAAKRNHEPFAGHSPESVSMIVAGRSQTDSARVLWENFEQIFLEIFEQDKNFVQKDFLTQKAIVEAKTEEFKARVQIEKIEADPNFNDPDPNLDDADTQ